MDPGAVVGRHAFCVSCGPNAKKCVRKNASCRDPKIELNEKAYEKAKRAWMLAKRRTNARERAFVFNYYDYHDKNE